MLSFTKNPSEDYPIAFEFFGKLPAGTLIVAGSASAFRHADGYTATLVAASIAEATTLMLDQDPGAGALLLIDEETETEETVYVKSVTGSNPWTVTLLTPCHHPHANQAVVSYQPGATHAVLRAIPIIVSEAGRAIQVWVKDGVNGQKYEISAFVSLNNNATIRDEVLMRVETPS